MQNGDVDVGRRRFLTTATTVIGGVGVLFTLFPFLASWKPSAKAQAAGAPIDVDLAQLEIGQQITVEWRRKPIWIIYRSTEMVDGLPQVDDRLRDPNSYEDQQPAYAKNEYRSIKSQYFVAVATCTHLGCIPTYRPDVGSVNVNWPGGFFCPCHGSAFDMAGRVFKGVPAPLNLEIPPYRYLSDSVVRIGEDPIT